MTADVITRVRRKRRGQSPFHHAIMTGIVFGIVAVYLAVVGILPMINERAIIVDSDSNILLTMAQTALLAIGLGAGAYVARRGERQSTAAMLLDGLIAGAIAGALLALLVIIMDAIDLRSMFIAL